jgi:membrane associated rhomboid family serine protease
VSESDLFVVCKNCSSEVSPYVTECPYCGQRVRKRAPKIERGASTPGILRNRSHTPRLTRLRSGEIPGIAAESRPYATGVLIAVAIGGLIAVSTGKVDGSQLGAVIDPVGRQWWRVLTTPFIFEIGGLPSLSTLMVAFITLGAIGIFGSLFERRFGAAATVFVFFASGAAGAGLAIATSSYPALAANGAALGLLCAWLVDDRLALRRGDERGNDMIGVWVVGVALLLLPVADTDVSFFAGIGGAAAGGAVGALLSPLRP